MLDVVGLQVGDPAVELVAVANPECHRHVAGHRTRHCGVEPQLDQRPAPRQLENHREYRAILVVVVESWQPLCCQAVLEPRYVCLQVTDRNRHVVHTGESGGGHSLASPRRTRSCRAHDDAAAFGVASIMLPTSKHGASDRFFQAWLVPRMITVSPGVISTSSTSVTR